MAPNHLGSMLTNIFHFFEPCPLIVFRSWLLIFFLSNAVSIEVLAVLKFYECPVPFCILFFEFGKSIPLVERPCVICSEFGCHGQSLFAIGLGHAFKSAEDVQIVGVAGVSETVLITTTVRDSEHHTRSHHKALVPWWRGRQHGRGAGRYQHAKALGCNLKVGFELATDSIQFNVFAN